MRFVYALLAAGLALFFLIGEQSEEGAPPATTSPPASERQSGPDSTITVDTGEIAGQDQFGRADVGEQVRGSGTVVRVLPDDNEGSRHQRFILRLSSGQTLLVAHNIDLAPRIPGLTEGDTVEFYGEYEWNDQGGVVHWTHHDPNGRQEDGWLRNEGRTYQ